MSLEAFNIEKTLLRPTNEVPCAHKIVSVALQEDWIYYVKTTKGHEFTARWLGNDKRGRAVFMSKHGNTSWLSYNNIETVMPLRKAEPEKDQ
jgi:hypothetical protein